MLMKWLSYHMKGNLPSWLTRIYAYLCGKCHHPHIPCHRDYDEEARELSYENEFKLFKP